MRQDWQSPALDNARAVLQLLSNLGSGAINVPGLQAAGKVGVQIIDIIKVGDVSTSCKHPFMNAYFSEHQRE